MNAEKVAQYITSWLKDYVQRSGTTGFVVGISGGIDSAVTSTLCAATGCEVLCIELPIHQSEVQVERAKRHIDQLENQYASVCHQEIDLVTTFDALKNQLPKIQNDELALVNVRARLRMTTLYYFAGIKNMLVAGTGNKIEDFGVGFYTKYGDGGVDLSPIADLTKSEVYELGEFLGVGDDIMKAAPTDGLWGDDRTDEDQIGANYPELEWAMTQNDLGKTSENFSGREKEVMEIFLRLNRANQHKMVPIPVCVVSEEVKRGQ